MNPIAEIGRKSNFFFSHLASISKLTYNTLYWTFIAPFYRKSYSYHEVVFQMDRVGVQSFGIVSLVTFLIGVILVLQTAYLMEPYGQLTMVPGGVAVSLTREIGPLLVAIVVTGRVGAAYAAELGAMKVGDEVMALQCMAVNPVGFLVAPRFLALLIMLPVLTVYGNFMGMLGGYMVGTIHYGIAHSVYIDNTFDFMETKDITSGIMKSVVFAVIIAMVGAYKGFTVEGGSVGVGKATMQAVVTCIVLIIASDALFTAYINTFFV
ncbi:MlaE family ABC transporter permease [Planctomycetota bacterium]